MNKTPQDWLDTYYPTKADSPKAIADPISHSLRKWEGLVTPVLDEHGLFIDGTTIQSVEGTCWSLSIDDSSCALCTIYEDFVSGCEGCPLSIVRGGYRCDVPTPEETASGRKAPYGEFSSYGDPYPMIALLEKAASIPKPKDLGPCKTT